jgi:DNA repair protein RadA/Sms
MAKKRQLFECQACGYQSGKWLGKCPNCGAWDQFLELNATQQEVLKAASNPVGSAQKARPITEIREEQYTRFSSNDS